MSSKTNIQTSNNIKNKLKARLNKKKKQYFYALIKIKTKNITTFKTSSKISLKM
jgi:hypothetical protein